MFKHAPRRNLRPLLLLISALSAATPLHSQTMVEPPVTSSQPTLPQTLDHQFNEALLAYERNHWLQAYDEFTLLAERGHADAARMVVQMHRHGPALYGQHFALSPLQQQRLAQQRLHAQALLGEPAAAPFSMPPSGRGQR